MTGTADDPIARFQAEWEGFPPFYGPTLAAPWADPECECAEGRFPGCQPEVDNPDDATLVCVEICDACISGHAENRAKYGDIDAARWLAENAPPFSGWHVGWDGRPEDDPYPEGHLIPSGGYIWVTTDLKLAGAQLPEGGA